MRHRFFIARAGPIAMPFQSDTTLGPYSVTAKIGEGGTVSSLRLAGIARRNARGSSLTQGGLQSSLQQPDPCRPLRREALWP